MSDEPQAPSVNQAELPQLPQRLLDPRPMIAVFTLSWIVAAIAAFAVPALSTWRPVTVAGVGLAAFGTSVFLWQRHAARRGSRGAQPGLR